MVKIYNTMSKQKEELITRDDGKVGIYVCGPTTYNYIHLGNARPLVFFDVVRRYLSYKGYAVTYVQNFTDIDDKIINRANEENIPPKQLAEKYIQEYFKDADALNVMRADIHPRVSGHMNEIIDMVSTLIKKGFAYEKDGDVYYSVEAFGDYGKLSGRSLDDMLAGARVDVDDRKRHPGDFALWKAAKEGEPFWESPWGKGRPGWHIECSAMSLKYLGNTFDIHGGGFDLIFPHHENEIAQSEACSGCEFAKYWMHNGFITVNQEKMSKSLGNFFIVRDIIEKFSPEVVRFYLLSTHYRSPLDFDDEKLQVSAKGLSRLENCYCKLNEKMNEAAEERLTEKDEQVLAALQEIVVDFDKAMDDDFNTALAGGYLFDLIREVNTYMGGSDLHRDVLERSKEIFKQFNQILGIYHTDLDGELVFAEQEENGSQLTDALLDLIIDLRQDARKQKNFAAADKIRDQLSDLGIVLEDSPQGTKWKVK